MNLQHNWTFEIWTNALLRDTNFAIHLTNGILLYSEEKQQDFFGCLARFLGCPGLREADNPEILPLRPRRGRKGQSSEVVSLEKAQTTQKSRLDHQKGRAVLASLYNRIFCCIFGLRSNSES